MNKSLITAAAIATLAISSTSAFATATANAQLTGLTISLSKIKNSGPAASASFSIGNGDAFYTYSYTYDPSSYQYVLTYGSTEFGEGGQSVTTGHADGSATLTGDAYGDDGAVVTTSANATGSFGIPSANYGQGVVYLGNGNNGGYTSFTLGVNTRMDISADFSISGNTTGALASGDYEYAGAAVYLSLQGTNGASSQTSVATASNYAYNYYGYQYTPAFSQTGELDVTFTGSKTAATSGTFYGYVQSYAYSNVSAVPEPTNAAFLLGGLAAIGLLARRRRAN